METTQLHRGRLIDHLQLVVSDLDASKRFYGAFVVVLGFPWGGVGRGFLGADVVFVAPAPSPAAAGELTGRTHVAFQAPDEATVARFHAAGLAAGGRDNGKPGPRPYHPGYHAAFLLDPAGNNVEVVFHGPAQRSARSVEIKF